MNKTITMGRLTDEPKVSQTQSGKKVAKFNMAVDRRGEGTDFPSFIAWEKRAEFIENYCHKGTKLLIEGHIQTGSYEKDGHKVYTTDIVVDSAEFCEKKGDTQPANPADEFMKIPDGINEEIPFA